MANVFAIIPYLVNQGPPIPLNSTYTIALPTTGVSVQDVSSSPTRSLSTGVNAYTLITVLATGTKYYVSTPYATIISTIA